jgi:hypothetical protein
MSSMSESHWWYLFDKEATSGDYTTWSRIWQFQTPAKKSYLQMHLLAEQSIFKGWFLSDFLNEGVKTYWMAPLSHLWTNDYVDYYLKSRREYRNFKHMTRQRGGTRWARCKSSCGKLHRRCTNQGRWVKTNTTTTSCQVSHVSLKLKKI